GAVAVAVDQGVFQELPGGQLFLELRQRDEVVVLPVDLPRPGRAGGAGNGVARLPGVGEAFAESGFPGAGRTGNEEEDACALGHGNGGRTFGTADAENASLDSRGRLVWHSEFKPRMDADGHG